MKIEKPTAAYTIYQVKLYQQDLIFSELKGAGGQREHRLPGQSLQHAPERPGETGEKRGGCAGGAVRTDLPHHRRQRRNYQRNGRNEIFPAFAGAHCRLDRNGGQRPVLRCSDPHRGMR